MGVGISKVANLLKSLDSESSSEDMDDSPSFIMTQPEGGVGGIDKVDLGDRDFFFRLPALLKQNLNTPLCGRGFF
jgi:hypothetical protein